MNLRIASSVSWLTWCSIPSLSTRATSSLTPSAIRKSRTIACRVEAIWARLFPFRVSVTGP